MLLLSDIQEAAEKIAQDATVNESQRNSLHIYLSASYDEMRYTADELFLRALLKCCASLITYRDKDRLYLKIWINKILKEIDLYKEKLSNV